MIEEHLPGGNTTSVVRIGDTVRRAAGPWTTTVQGYLRHLRAHGVVGIPEPFGVDDRGREIVSYLDGDVPHDTAAPGAAWLWSDGVLVEAGRFLRRLHDASVGFEPRRPAWRMPAHEPAEVICHNDVAPYNMVFRDGRLVGLIDFDTCSPGPRVWDLAYLAYRLAPFIGEDAPDLSLDDRLRRLDVLVAAYDMPFERTDVLEAMTARLDELATFTEQRATDTGRDEFLAHVALYRADRERIAALLTA
ncbi:phosphotransferase enzyme family protein [Luteimicrobium subarcticum]|uniref:phosphotransferase enzyme family protein n=1 Tax=Luteimicrobium subarcticum TaxID=620910 RepID=UPI000C24636C|nr:aminoglycoside phosphotransferase family protein [Luteimicrobium subarcticum]